MTWLSGPAVWSRIGGIVTMVLVAWLMLVLEVVPPPQQVWLRITNPDYS